MRLSVALFLTCAACTGGDRGDPAAPQQAPGGANGPATIGTRSASALARIAPPFDFVTTAGALDGWPVLVPGVATHAVTSFDRAGGNDDGFGGTWSTLYVDGDGRNVIFDATGPGVVRTIWFTSSASGDAPLGLGTVRFTFDAETRPRIAVDADAMFRGEVVPFVSPLVEDNHTTSGGFASWVPLVFRERLRISTDGRPGFYAVHYDTLPADWDVTSGVADAGLAKRFAEGLSALPLEEVPLDVTRTGSGVVDVLRFEPDAVPTDAAARAARFSAWFDGVLAIDVPLPTMFGSGLGNASVTSLVWTMQPTLWETRMPMPFSTSVRFAVTGLAGKLRLHLAPARAGAGTLAAVYQAESPTSADHDFVELEAMGAGKVVATVLAVSPVSPTTKQWWEGDQKVLVDGARTPAIHGTGHEDDFLGGWSNEFFSRPFRLPMQGEPRSDIVDMTGQVNANVSLYRLWPGIPFWDGVRATREHGPGNTRQANYAATTFFYRFPGGLVRTAGIDVAGSARTSGFTDDGSTTLTSTHRVLEDAFETRLAVDPRNVGVVVRFLHDASRGALHARLEVDGVEVTRIADVDVAAAARAWRERDVFVPASLTAGRSVIDVRLVPDGTMDLARVEALSVVRQNDR